MEELCHAVGLHVLATLDGYSRGVADIRFERPPVREVALTVFFASVDALSVTALVPLLTEWQRNYPSIEETFPERPRRLDTDAVRPLRSRWPCPLVTASDGTGNSVAVQSDRIIRRWAFSEGRYPGYNQLAAELEPRLQELAELCSTIGTPLVQEGASCEYRNEIDRFTSRQQAVGILTDWGDQASSPKILADFLGMHLHFHVEDCSVYATINGADEEEQFTLLLESETDSETGNEPLGGLQRAHDALVSTFLQLTSEEQQREWGQ